MRLHPCAGQLFYRPIEPLIYRSVTATFGSNKPDTISNSTEPMGKTVLIGQRNRDIWWRHPWPWITSIVSPLQLPIPVIGVTTGNARASRKCMIKIRKSSYKHSRGHIYPWRSSIHSFPDSSPPIINNIVGSIYVCGSHIENHYQTCIR